MTIKHLIRAVGRICMKIRNGPSFFQINGVLINFLLVHSTKFAGRSSNFQLLLHGSNYHLVNFNLHMKHIMVVTVHIDHIATSI